MTTVNIDELPQDVQNTIREGLTVQHAMYVERENGKYTAHYGLALDTRVKAADFKIFTFKNIDIYTQEQIGEFSKALPEMNW
jgi:hypothetical protein